MPSGRLLAVLIGLPGLVGGVGLMATVLGWPMFQLRPDVPLWLVFLGGWALASVGLLFAGPALGLFRGRRTGALFFGATGLLMLALMHYVVIYGKHSGVSVGLLTLRTKMPLVGYAALALVDGFLVWYLLFDRYERLMPLWARARPEQYQKTRLQLVVLAGVIFAGFVGADSLGWFGVRR